MDEYSMEIQKRLDALPKDIQELVYSADMTTIVGQIGAKYKLHIDQVGALESEAVAVMIGLTKAEEFVSNLEDALGIPEEQAKRIETDINELLFVKIRESMKNLYPSSKQGEPQPPPAPQTPTPQAMPEQKPQSLQPQQPQAPRPPQQPPQPPSPAQPPKPQPQPKPAPRPDLSAADSMLAGKTVSM